MQAFVDGIFDRMIFDGEQSDQVLIDLGRAASRPCRGPRPLSPREAGAIRRAVSRMRNQWSVSRLQSRVGRRGRGGPYRTGDQEACRGGMTGCWIGFCSHCTLAQVRAIYLGQRRRLCFTGNSPNPGCSTKGARAADAECLHLFRLKDGYSNGFFQQCFEQNQMAGSIVAFTSAEQWERRNWSWRSQKLPCDARWADGSEARVTRSTHR